MEREVRLEFNKVYEILNKLSSAGMEHSQALMDLGKSVGRTECAACWGLKVVCIGLLPDLSPILVECVDCK